MQVYDPIANTWSTDNPINTARDGVTGGIAGDLGGRIYVMVGSTGMSPVNTNERSVEIVHIDEVSTRGKHEVLHIVHNPFNTTTEIRFYVDHAGPVKLQLFDAQGISVATIVDGYMHDGEHTAMINGSNLACGVYFLKYIVGNFQITKKVLLLR